MGYQHIPVLLEEVLAYLDPQPGEVYVDATLGGAGHGAEILKRIIPSGFLIGIDRDREALEKSRKNTGRSSRRLSSLSWKLPGNQQYCPGGTNNGSGRNSFRSGGVFLPAG
ncbi:MAG: 16S rRNA (cytosine(1402)-N(4))-methyltransferase [Bacillota bacterium]